MKPKWQKLARLAQKVCTLWFQFFDAFFASKGYPIKNILLNLKQNRYNLCVRVLQVMVKKSRAVYLSTKTMQSFRPKFYANASLSSQVLYCKKYIYMYLDAYLTKLWLSAKKNPLKSLH